MTEKVPKPLSSTRSPRAKAAEIYLSSALALELGDAGIRVNTVCPGSIVFPGGGWDRFRRDEPESFHAFAEREFPAKRFGSAEEVADAVTFLVSDRASWINGAMIPVDGAQGRPRPY